MTFRKNYAIAALLLFITEVLIALFLRDRFVRPYVGDFLVVMLVYCFVRAFFRISVTAAAAGTLAFAFAVEGSQHFNFVQKLGLQNVKPLAVALGSSFEWADLLAYMLGTAAVLLIENRRKKESGSSPLSA